MATNVHLDNLAKLRNELVEKRRSVVVTSKGNLREIGEQIREIDAAIADEVKLAKQP